MCRIEWGNIQSIPGKNTVVNWIKQLIKFYFYKTASFSSLCTLINSKSL